MLLAKPSAFSIAFSKFSSTPLREIGIQLGSNSRKQLTADFSGPLSETVDYRLTFLSDACADRDAEVHRVLTEKVFPRQADVVTVGEWVSALG